MINLYINLTFQLLPDLKRGGLRRAHSEELVSEVGVAKNTNVANGDANNNDIEVMQDFFAAKLGPASSSSSSGSGRVKPDPPSPHNGLRVSDQPMGRGRVRRNSAGDEISSILDHEAALVGSDGGFYSTRRAAAAEPALLSLSEVEREDCELTSTTLDATGSSLNTTVVANMEAQDR